MRSIEVARQWWWSALARCTAIEIVYASPEQLPERVDAEKSSR